MPRQRRRGLTRIAHPLRVHAQPRQVIIGEVGLRVRIPELNLGFIHRILQRRADLGRGRRRQRPLGFHRALRSQPHAAAADTARQPGIDAGLQRVLGEERLAVDHPHRANLDQRLRQFGKALSQRLLRGFRAQPLDQLALDGLGRRFAQQAFRRHDRRDGIERTRRHARRRRQPRPQLPGLLVDVAVDGRGFHGNGHAAAAHRRADGGLGRLILEPRLQASSRQLRRALRLDGLGGRADLAKPLSALGGFLRDEFRRAGLAVFGQQVAHRALSDKPARQAARQARADGRQHGRQVLEELLHQILRRAPGYLARSLVVDMLVTADGLRVLLLGFPFQRMRVVEIGAGFLLVAQHVVGPGLRRRPHGLQVLHAAHQIAAGLLHQSDRTRLVQRLRFQPQAQIPLGQLLRQRQIHAGLQVRILPILAPGADAAQARVQTHDRIGIVVLLLHMPRHSAQHAAIGQHGCPLPRIRRIPLGAYRVDVGGFDARAIQFLGHGLALGIAPGLPARALAHALAFDAGPKLVLILMQASLPVAPGGLCSAPGPQIKMLEVDSAVIRPAFFVQRSGKISSPGKSVV